MMDYEVFKSTISDILKMEANEIYEDFFASLIVEYDELRAMSDKYADYESIKEELKEAIREKNELKEKYISRFFEDHSDSEQEEETPEVEDIKIEDIIKKED